METWSQWRLMLGTWCLRTLKSLRPAHIVLVLVAALWFRESHADGQQEAGPPSPCPFGQTLVRASIGPYTIGEICLSAAELERWFPTAERDGKPLPVRVLIVKERR